MSAELPSECPPVGAQRVEAEYLRFVSPKLKVGDSTGPEDWVVPHLQPKSPCFGHAEDCENHAHSLLADERDVEKARQLIPAFRKKRIATVLLTRSMGVVEHDPQPIGDSHHNWWPEPSDLVPDSIVSA
jgi:hypothetical protein